ncbi:hypothetical protein L208DRAFT_1418997 [Tricholoma matsutake]|nr:hypothetical protein L208DRAFT_1418997 [Tricholoma matsutake 945]
MTYERSGPHCSAITGRRRTPESSAKSVIQIVVIFIRTDFGGFYPEIGSGPQICRFLSALYLRPMRKSLKFLRCAAN